MLMVREVAREIGATASGVDARFSRVITDTRALLPNDLYVALRGPNFDGHRFVRAAFDLGAAAALVESGFAFDSADAPLIYVDDTRLALGSLAALWRSRFALPLAAVTGSNGKTTVKEMLAAILRESCRAAGILHGAESSVLATAGNLNNDIGVPLTLLRLRQYHRYAVVEMGMNHAGEIGYLTRMVRPAVALVNNVQRAHLGMLGSVEAVAHAKGEIFEGLGAAGTAIINADDPSAPLLRELAGKRPRLEFGTRNDAAVSATYKLEVGSSRMGLVTPIGNFPVHLQVPGMHNVRNALAASAAAIAIGADAPAIAAGLQAFTGVQGRLQRKAGKNGAILLDDTYNANPDSVAAAIQVLASAHGTRILVLGDLGEIGPEGPGLHAQIGASAQAARLDHLFALGDLSAAAAREFGSGASHFTRLHDLLQAVAPLLHPDVTVLVKGSRFMRMEQVVTWLQEPDPAKGESDDAA